MKEFRQSKSDMLEEFRQLKSNMEKKFSHGFYERVEMRNECCAGEDFTAAYSRPREMSINLILTVVWGCYCFS